MEVNKIEPLIYFIKSYYKKSEYGDIVNSLILSLFNDMTNLDKIETINYLIEEFKKLKPGVYIKVDYDKNIRKISTAKAQHIYYLRNRERLKEYSKNRYANIKKKQLEEKNKNNDDILKNKMD